MSIETNIRNKLLTLGRPVYVQRPIPSIVDYPVIIISPNITMKSRDFVNVRSWMVRKDILIYGLNDTSEKYKEVEEISKSIIEMFHLKNDMISGNGIHCIQVKCSNSTQALNDGLQLTGNVITMDIWYQDV